MESCVKCQVVGVLLSVNIKNMLSIIVKSKCKS